MVFADALPHEIALVRRMRDRARAAERWMHTQVLPAAQATERAGFRHRHTVARLGADTYGFFANLLDQLAADLERDAG